MIYVLLLLQLFAADTKPQDTPIPKQTPEISRIKEEKIKSLRAAAKELDEILESDDPSVSELLSIEDRLNLSRHNPTYFAAGKPLSKLQLSLKYRLLKEQQLYFGFTQILFWDLGQDSRPFRDTTYNPELIYTYPIKNIRFLESLDFGIWEHNSNGKDELASRSFERNYVKLNMEHEYQEWVLRTSIKLGYIHGLDDTNTDIQNYISPLELKITLVEVLRGALDKSELSLRFFPGGKYADRFDKGGFELGLSFRLGGLDIVPSFYMQYFNGYAESLINYDERVNEFRAGFIF